MNPNNNNRKLSDDSRLFLEILQAQAEGELFKSLSDNSIDPWIRIKVLMVLLELALDVASDSGANPLLIADIRTHAHFAGYGNPERWKDHDECLKAMFDKGIEVIQQRSSSMSDAIMAKIAARIFGENSSTEANEPPDTATLLKRGMAMAMATMASGKLPPGSMIASPKFIREIGGDDPETEEVITLLQDAHMFSNEEIAKIDNFLKRHGVEARVSIMPINKEMIDEHPAVADFVNEFIEHGGKLTAIDNEKE